jgi:hypothetical protein
MALVTLVCAADTADAEEAESVTRERPRDPLPYPTPLWLAAQLLPSPEIADVGGDLRGGARWQLTPVLYSFGINRQLSPWRFFVVEPNVRQSGSIEAYVSPEFLDLGRGAGDWGLRSGMRAYFPLVERGDYLSCSVGVAHTLFEQRSAVAYEAGVYAFYGIVGLQVTYAPSGFPASTILTARLRYF